MLEKTTDDLDQFEEPETVDDIQEETNNMSDTEEDDSLSQKS